MARWIGKLQEFDFEIVHRQGRCHANADAMSRMPCNQCGRGSHGREHPEETNEAPIVMAVTHTEPDLLKVIEDVGREDSSAQDHPSPVSAGHPIGQQLAQTSPQELWHLQLADEDLGTLLRSRELMDKPDTEGRSREFCQLVQLWDLLTVESGVLYKRHKDNSGTTSCLQWIVPETVRLEILPDLHSGAVGGHLGSEKMLSRLQEQFFWPRHTTAIKEWCRTCTECAARKSQPPKRHAPLQNVKAGYPMQLVAMDILGPLPESSNRNSYVLVATDYFTRWVEAYAIPNQEASTVATKLVDQMFCRFAIPD